MIRVLHIVNIMNYGGLESFIMNIYRNIDRDKIQFDFLVHTDQKGQYDDEIISLGGKIYSITPRNQGLFKNRKSLNSFFKKHTDYKIVHAHLSSLSYLTPLKIAKKNNVPIRIIHAHSTKEGGFFFHKYLHSINKFFFKNIANSYFSCSDLATKWMFNESVIKEDNYKIINNAIDLERFKFNEDSRKIMRKKLNLKDNNVVVGHVGRFTLAKNHEFLLEVFKEFHKVNKEAKLLLVGNGELKEKIERKIMQLNLNNSVIMTGSQPCVEDFMQAMDVFLFPSIYEGLPVTLVEAQANGLPCIVSNVITQQVNISDDIEFVDLDESTEYWRKKIEEKNIGKRRDKMTDDFKCFNIKEITKDLENYYIKRYGVYEI